VARGDSRKVALLSIRPRFARAILSGEKRVELRRRPIGESVSHVVVYATAPVQKVVGWFEVGAIQEGSPHVLWKAHGHAASVTRDEFRAYYRGA
jgi:predicted transcriptional regulator